LAGAGAFPRDAVDTRIVNEVRTGTAAGSGVFGANKGIIDSPDAVGGYPAYNTYDVPVDSDHDGMPDAWETANGLNPDDPADGNLYTASGYTVLEVYLNSLAGETIALNLTSIAPVKNNALVISKKDNQLYISSGKAAVTSVKIYNAAGKTVKTKTSGDLSIVDLSGLSTGVYIAEAKTANKEKQALKFTL
jgi:hypothetical protein